MAGLRWGTATSSSTNRGTTSPFGSAYGNESPPPDKQREHGWPNNEEGLLESRVVVANQLRRIWVVGIGPQVHAIAGVQVTAVQVPDVHLDIDALLGDWMAV